MTANIMKLVNSAFFGSRRPITTTDRAVAYLGMDTIGALVLGHSVFKSGVATGIPGFNLEQLWQHSLQTGAAARAIALSENLATAKVDEAFLAGVLHDVGKIIFATKAATLPNDAGGIGVDLAAQMEAHHAEVGAYLLGLWGFPNPIVDAVAFHHAPSHSSDTGLGLSGIVHIANRLVHQGSKNPLGSFEPALEPQYLDGLGLGDHMPKWSAAVHASGDQRAA
jgi:putative nucleotidyltransferase with HDIG domain